MKAQWISGKYNFYFLHLPGGFTVTVGWDSTSPKGSESGFKVSFENLTLKGRFVDLELAKQKGEQLAKHALTEALEAL